MIEKWFEEIYDIGKTKDDGVERLAYTKEEDLMHDMIISFGKEFGLKVKKDYLGNSFLYYNEFKKDYTLIASHADSVLNGGRYDGVIGVLIGLDVLRKLKGTKYEDKVILGIFRCEESTVFNTATVGSSFAAGNIKMEKLNEIKNKEGKSLKEILDEKEYSKDKDFKIIDHINRYLEVHIEQGRVLWEKGIDIGVVTAIAAPQRFRINIKGSQDHSGATPMGMRKDALAGTAEIITMIEEIGNSEKENQTVATVGVIHAYPGSINVIPGSVSIDIDIRGIDKESIKRTVKRMKENVGAIAEKRNLEKEIIYLSGSDPVLLDEKIIKDLYNITDSLNLSSIKMPSGAGHDAMEFGDKVATGMLFIPNKDGISHNPDEFARIKDIENAKNVLYEYILKE